LHKLCGYEGAWVVNVKGAMDFSGAWVASRPAQGGETKLEEMAKCAISGSKATSPET